MLIALVLPTDVFPMTAQHHSVELATAIYSESETGRDFLRTAMPTILNPLHVWQGNETEVDGPGKKRGLRTGISHQHVSRKIRAEGFSG